MQSLRFKSSLKCAGCVHAIKPFMERINGIVLWNVDLTSPDKTIDVVSTVANKKEIVEEIQNAVRAAGYKAEII